MKKHDFITLETALWESNCSDSDAPREGQIVWQTAYIEAIEKAILMDNINPLISLMKEKHPIHPMLLPALADAIKARGQNKRSGVKRKLTDTQAQNVARAVQHLRLTGISAFIAIGQVADRFEISDSTAKRAYLEHIPDYRRSALNRRRL